MVSLLVMKFPFGRNLKTGTGLKKQFSLAFLLLLIGVLSGCDWWASLSQPKTDADTSKPTVTVPPDESRNLLKRAIYAQTLILQPQQLQNDQQLPLIQDLYEGLVRFDKNGAMQGGAAESWQQQDHKVWIFQLRPDLKWSNGEALTAQDFVQSWYALAAQGKENPLSEYLRFIALENVDKVLSKEYGVEMLGIKALDATHLQLTLSQPIPYLPQMLSHVALFPQYQGENDGTLVSNGPYHLLYHSQSDLLNDLLLEKNPFYWNNQRVAFRNVGYHTLQNSDDPSEYDLVQQPSGIAISPNGMQLLELPSLCNYYYEFNFRNPRLKQSAVRKAIVAMVSLPEIVSGNVSSNIDSKNSFESIRANPKFLPRNLQAQEQEDSWTPTVVEQLLSQTDVNSRQPLRLRLTYEQQGIHPQIAERLIRMLSQSDLIQIQAEAVTRQQLLERRAKGDFDLIQSGWCADYPDPSAFLNILHSQSTNNKMAYHDEKVDALLQQSLQADVTEPQRLQLYTEIEKIINQEQVVLPLFQYYHRYWIKPDLSGYASPAVNSGIASQDLYRKVSRP